MIRHSNSINLPCFYCNTQCQFDQITKENRNKRDGSAHFAYRCVSCNGIITTIWRDDLNFPLHLRAYHPRMGEWKSRIDPSLIPNKIKDDFQETIRCYNNNLYNACMIMARRTVQHDLIVKNIESKNMNLYEQIEKTGISENLKNLLHKVRIFGNYGAHPTLFLYDNNGNRIEEEEKRKIAKLSLEFLDRYFMETYEIDELLKDLQK